MDVCQLVLEGRLLRHNMNKTTFLWGLRFIIVAITFGAFGAHAFNDVLSENQLKSFEVGVRYQMYVGILLLVFANYQNRFKLKRHITLLIIGSCLFSISIYGLCFINQKEIRSVLGPITPIGGVLMISSLVWMFITVLNSRNNN